ncbi:MAG: hypothetical protein AB7F29_13865 [Candidatus Nitrosocosmicus sp.]
MQNKYRIKLNDLERVGGIARLERDGFNRHQIMKAVHQEMRGATQDQKSQIVDKLYRRNEPC